MTKEEIIQRLNLEPLRDEGGFFRRIFTHPVRVDSSALPKGFNWSRELLTGIYYLITDDSFSALHRLHATETFHFHCGDTVEMLQLGPNGRTGWHMIGNSLKDGVEPFVTVPGGNWQGSRLKMDGTHGYALLSVMVSPGFDWEDFELGDRKALTAEFPDWQDAIQDLTR